MNRKMAVVIDGVLKWQSFRPVNTPYEGVIPQTRSTMVHGNDTADANLGHFALHASLRITLRHNHRASALEGTRPRSMMSTFSMPVVLCRVMIWKQKLSAPACPAGRQSAIIRQPRIWCYSNLIHLEHHNMAFDIPTLPTFNAASIEICEV